MIKRERSALPLPRYVLRKPSPQGVRQSPRCASAWISLTQLRLLAKMFAPRCHCQSAPWGIDQQRR
jgi:hypothetical protein